MATYKGICKLTNKEEIIWFDMIDEEILSNSNVVTIGLMNDCSAQKKFGIGICADCNLYKDLPHNMLEKPKNIDGV